MQLFVVFLYYFVHVERAKSRYFIHLFNFGCLLSVNNCVILLLLTLTYRVSFMNIAIRTAAIIKSLWVYRFSSLARHVYFFERIIKLIWRISFIIWKTTALHRVLGHVEIWSCHALYFHFWAFKMCWLLVELAGVKLQFDLFSRLFKLFIHHQT